MSVYRDAVMNRFGGIISHGKHLPDGIACALEVASIARGRVWSDSPETAGLPDLRRLNDARWSSDVARTTVMLPVIEVYWDWSTWAQARHVVIMKRVAEGTIRRVLPLALSAVGLIAEAGRCEREGTEESARNAATAAVANAAAVTATAANAGVTAYAAASSAAFYAATATAAAANAGVTAYAAASSAAFYAATATAAAANAANDAAASYAAANAATATAVAANVAAAAAAAATAAFYAAAAAANAADTAANAADTADHVLTTACAVWIEAVNAI